MRTRSQSTALVQVFQLMQGPPALDTVLAVYDRMLRPDCPMTERLYAVAIQKLKEFEGQHKMPKALSERYQELLRVKWQQTPKTICELFERRGISM